MKEEVIGTFVRENYRKPNDDDQPDWLVCAFLIDGKEFECTGADHEWIENCDYRLYGEWSERLHWKSGKPYKQFKIYGARRCRPVSREAIVGYIAKMAKGLGIGPEKAGLIHDQYGEDSCEAVRTKPEAIVEICGISEENARLIASKLIANEATETALIELTDLLAGRKFRGDLPKAVLAKFGLEAHDLIKRNPYLLLPLPGCGFITCDAMYLDLGLPATAIKRQVLCAWDEMVIRGNGSVWHTRTKIEQTIQSKVGATNGDVAKAVDVGVRLGQMNTEGFGAMDKIRVTQDHLVSPVGPVELYAPAVHADDEDRLARYVAAASNERPTEGVCVANLEDVTDHQREELWKALQGNVGILSGLPGTGKTFTTGRFMRRFVEKHGAGSVVIGCPTGKAATRLTESLADAGVGITARTWHSILKPEGVTNGRWEFEHGEGKPLGCQLMVIDESSMVDLQLMLSIFAARPRGCRVLLIGDPNQLAPVGVGRPFCDLIEAGLPRGHLTEIQRNAGAIVQACHAIQAGRPWQPGENLIHHDVSLDEIPQTVLSIINEQQKAGVDVRWDVQTLSPKNKKGDVSCEPMNALLTQALVSSPGYGGWPWREGDKVICTRNQELPGENGPVYVANGDQGIVKWLNPVEARVEIPTTDEIVKITKGQSKEWKLAFCITIHKSQGSDWPVTIFIADKTAARMMDRSLVYTALSRAKGVCYVVGPRQVLDDGCRRQAIDRRFTLLKQKINLFRCEEKLQDL